MGHNVFSIHLPDMPSSLPRWIRTSAHIGCFLVPHRPSPYLGRVGIHNFPFEACSRFTRVTACRFAAYLKVDICPQNFSRKVSLSHCLGSYRDEPTISRAGLPPAGNLHLRGAPRYCGGKCLQFNLSNLASISDIQVISEHLLKLALTTYPASLALEAVLPGCLKDTIC